MTAKSFLRFLIGYVIAAILMGLLLPLIGIPRAELLPPPLVYANASKQGTGVWVKKWTDFTSNPFHTGDKVYLVQYAFRATSPKILGSSTPPGQSTRYYGVLNVEQPIYDSMRVGDLVMIKYDPTYPDINGLVNPALGRSGGPGSTIFSGWWLWLALNLVLAYAIAPLLERVMLRESY